MNHRVIILGALVLGLMTIVGCGGNSQALSKSTPVAAQTRPPVMVATSLPQPSPTGSGAMSMAMPTRAAALPASAELPAQVLPTDLSANRTTVTLMSFSYSPSMLKARVGQPIRLELRNADAIMHEFAIDNTGIGVLVLPNTSQKLDLVFNQPGTYTFACNVVADGDHRSAGMTGTLTVTP